MLCRVFGIIPCGRRKKAAEDKRKCSLGDLMHDCKGPFYLVVWLLWLLTGTLFYTFAHGNELGLYVGFYQAVNIGYSIGYGFPRETAEQNWWFSSAFVICGASLVGVALGFFADKIVEDRDAWFTNMLKKNEYERKMAKDQPFTTRLVAFVKFNQETLRAIFLWGVWVAIMIMYSMIQVKWPFSKAQYFAVSTCSTGGHMPIPDDSPDWLFGVTGFFAAVGVPLMGVAMASLGSLIMERRDDLEEMKKTIEEEVTAEELLELQRFGLEDGDGEVDRSEFIILCMVRLGTDPRLVQFISDQFKTLDIDNSNSLSILEITRGRHSCEDLQKLARGDSYKELWKSRESNLSSSLTSIKEENRHENREAHMAEESDEENHIIRSNTAKTGSEESSPKPLIHEDGGFLEEKEFEDTFEDNFQDNCF